jgi:hypothetical protein
MAKVPCTFAPKSMKAGAAPLKKATAGDPIATIALTNDPNKPGDNNYLVNGTNARGEVVDISAVATIAITDDPNGGSTSTVSGPNTFQEQGVAAGSSTSTITLTFTSGTPAPISGDVLWKVAQGGVTGFTVTPVLPVPPPPPPAP